MSHFLVKNDQKRAIFWPNRPPQWNFFTFEFAKLTTLGRWVLPNSEMRFLKRIGIVRGRQPGFGSKSELQLGRWVWCALWSIRAIDFSISPNGGDFVKSPPVLGFLKMRQKLSFFEAGKGVSEKPAPVGGQCPPHLHTVFWDEFFSYSINYIESAVATLLETWGA